MTTPEQRTDSISPADPLLRWLDAQRRWLFALVGLFYLAGYSTQWRPGSDSGLYLVLGRNLLRGDGYTFSGDPHGLVHPLMPWMLGGLWQVTGISIAAANVMVMACLLGGVGLWYRALSMRFGRPRAVAITLMIAGTETVFRYAFQVLTEPVFFLGIAAVVAGYEGVRAEGISRRRLVCELALFTLGMFIAIAARPFMWAMVAAVGVAGLWHLAAGPKRCAHGVMLGLTGVALGVFRLIDPREIGSTAKAVGYEGAIAHRLGGVESAVDKVIDVSIPQWFNAHAIEAAIGIELGPFNWLGGLVVLTMGVVALRWRPLWAAFFLFTTGIMLLYTPVVRYFMPLIPIVAVGWFAFAEWLLRRRAWYLHWLAVAVLLLWLIPNVGRSVGFVIDQRDGLAPAVHRDGFYQPMIELTDPGRVPLETDAVIVGNHGRELAWFSDRHTLDAERIFRAVRRPPPIDQLLTEARPVYIILPVYDQTLARLRELGFEPGALVATAEPLDDQPPAELRRLKRIDTQSDTVSP
jgi:hypothetical protein